MGAALGMAATAAFALSQDWPAVIPFTSVAAGFGGAVLVGVAAGLYPSVRASCLTPVEALAGG